MLLRTAVGACAGCGGSLLLVLPVTFSFWMLAGVVLIYAGFRASRVGRVRWAAGIGSALWFVLYLTLIYINFHLDMYQEDAHRFMTKAYVIAPCVAYAIAALCTGSRRTA